MNNARAFDPQTAAYVSLASFRRNGKEVLTTVWIAGSDGRYYVFSAGNAGKVKRIRANPSLRLAACDAAGRVLSSWIDGTARVVNDPEVIARAYALLRGKYGWRMRLLDFLARLSGRYVRRAIIEIDAPNFASCAPQPPAAAATSCSDQVIEPA